LRNIKTNFNEAISSLEGKGIIRSQAVIPLDDKLICQIQSFGIESRASNAVSQIPEKPEAPQVPRWPVGTSGPPSTVKSSVVIAENLDHRVPGDLTIRVSVDEENNEHSLIPDMPNRVETVDATLAGYSLFLLMMYKYTPLGSWVNTKILRKDKLMENMNKNNYELLLNDVGNHEASLNDTMYHIRYNSETNH
ncbi:Plasmodium vivax Vir protein, putative, partial [Plasmodium vivax]